MQPEAKEMKTRTPSLPLSISFPDFAGMVVLFFPFFAGRQFTVNARWSRLGPVGVCECFAIFHAGGEGP
jgi:hypothetical protein